MLKKFTKFIDDFKIITSTSFESSNNDLYFVEFPKSGVTWLSTIFVNALFLESEIKLRATYFNLEQFVGDFHISKKIESNCFFPYYRIIKSHENYNPNYRHVIYILRNPFSVMDSYYQFCTSKNIYTGNFENFIRHPEYGVDNWMKHVELWIDKENKQKLHLIKYEDLKKNAFDSISNLFMNLGILISDKNINKAIELSDLTEMKKSNELYIKYSPYTKTRFVRTGKIVADLNESDREYIRSQSKNILEKFYPELI